MPEKVSSSFTKSDWLEIRTHLKDKGLVYKEWNEAIQLIDERVTERYLKPLQLLINHKTSYKGSGFTIATIECSLIEFIASLTEGKVFLKDKPQNAKDYYYDDSAKLYRRFLRTATIFNPYFFAPKGTTPKYQASDFYKNVRCALIHEAQTKNNWEIRLFLSSTSSVSQTGSEKDLNNKQIIDTDTFGKKVVYRTALFFELQHFFKQYCNESLKENSRRGMTLRKYLARKIDYILEIPADNMYWW
jgi:hypothetical protein